MRRSTAAFLHIALTIFGLLGFGGAAAFAAKPIDGAIGPQEAATPVMHDVVSFHNGFLMPIMTAVVLFVMVMLIYIMLRFNEKANPVPSKTSHNTMLEVLWTTVPVLIVLVITIKSLDLLNFMDRIPETDMTIKVTGNTWNWEYGYPEHENVEPYISNVLSKEDADAAGVSYLLATDAPLVIPVGKKIKALVTSNANLHAFAVPSFAVKIDAVPGRVNEVWFQVEREGTYYGSCSEICGINHAFMPIEVKVVSQAEFDRWIANDGSFETVYSLNQTTNPQTIKPSGAALTVAAAQE